MTSYLINSWDAWNIIHGHVSDHIYNERTKYLAMYLVIMGVRSKFIQCLANGNIKFPDEVIEVALEIEKLDKIAKGD